MEMEIEEAQVDWVDTEGPANVDEMPVRSPSKPLPMRVLPFDLL
jgi:hypothetical protein